MTQEREAIAVAPLADFPAGSHRVVTVGGREIGIFNVRGTLHALPNLCPHQLGPLCKGGVSGTLRRRLANGWQLEWAHDGEIVTCPWHGIEYHIPTGQCLAHPEITLRRYEVWVEDGMVMLRR